MKPKEDSSVPAGPQSMSRRFNEKKHFLLHWTLDHNSSVVQLTDIAICNDRFYLQYMNIKCIEILKTAKSTFGIYVTPFSNRHFLLYFLLDSLDTLWEEF